MGYRCLIVALVILGSRTATAQAPPFRAWLDAGGAYVHEDASGSSPIVGLLSEGDLVTVVGCEPSCDAPHAWALLSGDGAVPLALLRSSPEDDDHAALNAEARYFYGTVRHDQTPLFKAPHVGRIAERLKAGRVLAFRMQQPFADSGWFQASEGGFVWAPAIRFARPSSFSGVTDPPEVEAFTIRKVLPRLPRGQFGPPVPLDRHTPLQVIEVNGNSVMTRLGLVSRDDVRLAYARTRPPGVATNAKWVHVDLEEQTLTAYEGDRLVFSTLVSTGKWGHRTPRGMFQVWLKAVHHRMTGREAEPYQVDEVPFAMFIDRGIALHGAFWHDAFGRQVSHGCVNLSVADAQWLFDWSPPHLPDGWHAAIPGPAHRETLSVRVERKSLLRHWRQSLSPELHPPLRPATREPETKNPIADTCHA